MKILPKFKIKYCIDYLGDKKVYLSLDFVRQTGCISMLNHEIRMKKGVLIMLHTNIDH